MAEEINLLRSTSPLSGTMISLEDKLRRAGVISAGVIVVIGLLTAFAYGLLRLQIEQLSSRKAEVLAAVAGQGQKEALLVALQSRLTTVEKVLAQAKPWSPALDMAAEISGNGIIEEAATDDQGRFTLAMTAPSLTDGLQSVREVRSLAEEGKIRTPMLESLLLEDDGSIHMRMSFFIIFP